MLFVKRFFEYEKVTGKFVLPKYNPPKAILFGRFPGNITYLPLSHYRVTPLPLMVFAPP